MDPNETLKMIDEFLKARQVGDCVDEWCRDLLEWLNKGGFEPDWDKYPSGTEYFSCRKIEEGRA